MKVKIAAAALGVVLVSAQAYAVPNHIFDYTYDGTSTTTNQSAAGAQLLDTEIVALTLRALGNDHWTASAGTSPWAPIGMQESGTRIGDLTWSFLLDGSVVESGSYTDQGSSFVHIAQPMGPLAANISFDELRWEFTQDSTTATPNTLGEIFSSPDPFASVGQQPTYVVVPDAAAPAPGSLALLGLALAGFGLIRRKRTRLTSIQ